MGNDDGRVGRHFGRRGWLQGGRRDQQRRKEEDLLAHLVCIAGLDDINGT
jgi:hypothetical protein